jgi:ZIP family zinc transporter
MNLSSQSFIWGFFSGSALLIGAVLGFSFSIPKKIIALVMAFGSGVLLSTLCFELIADAYKRAGLIPVGVGFLVGGVLYSLVNIILSKKGGGKRKKSARNKDESSSDESGTAIAFGSLLDGIPESIALGLSLSTGKVNIVTLVAIFISNIPEGLSSSAGMRLVGRKAKYVYTFWIGITFLLGGASFLGYTLSHTLSEETFSFILSLAAGGILTMVVDTMIPEAYIIANSMAGVAMLLGFLLSFVLSKTT